MKEINEDMLLQKEWYEAAKNVTLEDLPDFLDELMNDYGHDYVTLCHAFAAGALGTMNAMNNHENGGITRTQAGFIMMFFIRNWLYQTNKVGLAIVDYDEMLYPQFEEKFNKEISQETWDRLQEQARILLEKNREADMIHLISPDVYKHWQSIVDGVVPFGFSVQ